MRKIIVSKASLVSSVTGFLIGCSALRALRIFGGIFLLTKPTEFNSVKHASTVTNQITSQRTGYSTLGTHFNYTNGARDLNFNQRVLCWIMTGPKNHATKARAVKDTWAKHCDVTLFMSSSQDKDLPTVQLNVIEGRQQLWGKTREAFRYIWDNYKDKVDWFFKADDDTFAVIENLRYLLTGYNTSMPYFFGHRFQYSAESPDFFSGGAGYVLSKEAARRFVEIGYFDGKICRQDHETSAEDVEMSRCLKKLNTTFVDTRDSKGRGRFFPLIPGLYMSPDSLKPDDWFVKANYYPPVKPGLDCCSDTAITFHYIEPDQMRLLYYLVYGLRHGPTRQEMRPPIPEPPPEFDPNAPPYWKSIPKLD